MNHASVSSWALLGMTWNIAVKIGCHIDPSKLGLGVVEGEERRRCWAALMMLYTVQNTCLGNIAPQVIAADVDLPADKDDEELESSQNNGNGAILERFGPTKMSYILYKFRLYKIAAEICQLDPELSHQQTIVTLDQKLACEENEHTTRFSSQNLPLYHIVHHFILQSYTHHLYLILHRGSLGSHTSEHSGMLHSRQRCKTSAIKILEVHDQLFETAEFRPYRWYVNGLGSFHAFLAVSVLLVLSSTGSPGQEDSPRLLELVDHGINRFESMADRSEVCKKAVVILRRVMQNSSETARMGANTSKVRRTPLEKDGVGSYETSSASEPEPPIIRHGP